MKQYKIYLGLTSQDGVKLDYDKAVKAVKELMQKSGLSGATCYAADGVWQSEQEKSLVAEFIQGDSEHMQDAVTTIAKYLKAIYNQQSVLITSQDIEVWEA